MMQNFLLACVLIVTMLSAVPWFYCIFLHSMVADLRKDLEFVSGCTSIERRTAKRACKACSKVHL